MILAQQVVQFQVTLLRLLLSHYRMREAGISSVAHLAIVIKE